MIAGYSLATCGDFLVIGAPGYDGDRGKVYFLSLSTGHWHHEEIGENPGDNFGHSVAMASDSALIGAPGYNGFEGRAYLVVLPGFFLSFIDFPVDASASGPGHQFGGAVAMNENLALVSSWMDGDPVGNAGSVNVFNLRSLTEMGRLTAPDTIPSHFFGSSVALSGNQAAIGARGDSDLELLSGAVYLHRDLTGGLGMNSLAGNRQSAPGTVDAAFRTFRDAYLNPSGEVVFRANLGGPGASRGRNQGAWSNLTDGRVLGLVTRRQDPLTADVRIGNVVGAWSNHIDYAVVPAAVAGRPVNAGNREVLFIDDGTDLMGVLRTGVDNPFLGAQLRTMQEVVQSGRDRVTVAYRLRRGVSGVTATDDSGIMALAHTGATIDVGAREGRGIPAGEYRQFFGRVAESRDADFFGYPAFLETAGGNVRRQLFSDFAGGGLLYVAAEDGFAPGVGGARYRNFLGETMSENGSMIHRATLNGADVTARNREGIWHEIQGLCFRKGEEPWPFSSPGARFARFLGFWPARTNQVIAWIRLAGPGVTPANDGVLCLFQENGAFLVLLREGDLVPGSSDGARVRIIQRVDVEPELGSYVALVSLTGNPGRNQALYSGYTGVGNPVEETSLRKARLQLRKGAIFDAGLGGTTGIRSLSLSRMRDRAGAWGKGAGQVYGALQRVVMTVTFDDRSREIVVGNP